MREAAVSLPQLFAYPERSMPRETGLDRLAASIGGCVSALRARGRARRISSIIGPIDELGARLRGLDDAALLAESRAAAAELRVDPAWRDPAVLPALAVVREAASRALGMRAHDSQMLGAWAALNGMAAEMATGEGKTLVATLAACVAGLGAVPVHIVTANSYLAERDAGQMKPLYDFLCLTSAAVTERSPPPARAAAYRCDIVVCTNKDVAFDYMRDRLTMGRRRSNLRRKAARIAGDGGEDGLIMRGLHFAIVDEADSVLVDEACTPLILAATVEDTRDAGSFDFALDAAAALERGRDFILHIQERRVILSPEGVKRLERLASHGSPWDEAAERKRMITLALTALHILRRDEQYLVRDGRAEIIDEFTGRTMPDRSWSDGLQEMVERKEGLELSSPRVTTARTTYQRFYRRYCRLAGMSGTLSGVAAELWRVYRLPVVAIPLHKPNRKRREGLRCFKRGEGKLRAIAAEAERLRDEGRPVLIGARTLESSLRISAALDARGVAHVVLNAAQDAREAAIVAEAGAAGTVTVATNMAGRGTDIRLRPGVAAAGGLCVIIGEPNESGRIDRQLAGRCGRQGDPGLILAFASLDDDLMQRHCPSHLRVAAALSPGPIRWLAICALVGLSQRRAERFQARMRAELQEAEEWLGDVFALSGEGM